MLFLLILISVALFAWITWRDRILGLTLLAAALPTYLVRFSIYGFPSTLLELLVITLLVITAIKERSHRFQIAHLGPFALPMGLVLLAATLGIVVAPDPLAAFGIWKAYFIEPVLLLLVIHLLKPTKAQWETILAGLAAGAIVVSSVGILQFLLDMGIPAPWDVERRVTGVFDFPNALGLYLAPLVTFAAVRLILAKLNCKHLWLWIATLVLGSIAIILAETEAALLAVPLAVFLVTLFDKDLRRITIPLAITAVLIILVVPAIRGLVIEKVTLQDFSGQIRLGQWSETIELIQDRPLFGAGLSGYPLVFEAYHHFEHVEVFQYPHTILLNIWVELGLLGVIGFIWLAIVVLKTVMKEQKDPMVLAAFAALLQMTIHGLVDVPYFKNDLAIMTWLMITIIYVSRHTRARS